MKNFVKRFLLVSILYTIFLGAAYAEESEIIIKLDTNHILLNDTITVEIIAQDITNIVGADMQMNYDATKLQLISKQILTDDAIFIDIQQLNTDFDDTAGSAQILFGLKKIAEPITNPETVLATLTLKAIDIGEVYLRLMPDSTLIQETIQEGIVDYQYQSPLLPSTDIIIHIAKNAKIDGALTCSDACDPTDAIIKLFQDGQEQKRITLDASGSYTFSDIPDGNYHIIAEKPGYTAFEQSLTIQDGQDIHLDILLNRIKEDADRDGSTDLQDVAFIAQRIGLAPTDTHKDADINEDGEINMLDVVHITRQLE